MTLRRRRPLTVDVASGAERLKQIEASVALLDRVRPLNLTRELSRLTRACESGHCPEPEFEYAPAPQLAAVRRELADLAHALDAGDQEARLLAQRARELELEAALAEHVGQPDFAELAGRRFPTAADPSRTAQLAEQFLTARVASTETDSDIGHDSGDARDPHSLWSELARRLGAERWPVRIELVVGLVSLAAVGNGVVRVRAGARLSERVARRIALHEVEGHLRPQLVGQGLGGVFLAGSARGSEDEEGRAILLEERAGLLDLTRRQELARRYLAAASLRAGARFWDVVTLLGRRGARLDAAIELAARVYRGGGLGRELVYLTGYQRVAELLALRPGLERVLSSGRIALEAAQVLSEASSELYDDGDVI